MRRILLPFILLGIACEPKTRVDEPRTGSEADLADDADLDGDGYGGAEDCSEGDPAVNPGAVEVCNGIDDNCDGQVDEGTLATFWIDADGDGFGSAASPRDACEAPSGTVTNDTDCDDADSTVHPAAVEQCNGVDDNCSGVTDEGLEQTWYADADADGYGDPETWIVACEAPSNFVTDGTDCDDGEAQVSPAAEEVCDERDNDCDALVDEEVVTTFFIDLDGDGWGGFTGTADACTLPIGYAVDLGDCDDGNPEVHPAALEVCNTIDDDCDGDIDDDDSSVDLSTASTWYADADGDGEGDPDVTALTCDSPSGYVSNDTDCDDGDASDLDGDGIQDCADSDRDGDGLDNTLDGAPDDDSITRGPTGGTGVDGPWTVVSTETQSDWTILSSAASAGDTSLTVADASHFISGDEVLVLSQQGADAGTHQMVFVTQITGNTLTIVPELDDHYSGSSVVLVQRIPHYTSVTVPSGTTIAAEAWTGNGGGVVIFRATDTVAVAGSIDAVGMGFRGGDGVYGNSSDCTQGESITGSSSAAATTANDGGGGCHPKRGDNGDSGGGGGFGTAGSAGTNNGGSAVTDGGSDYGSADLATWFLGSGGGGGSPDTEGDGSAASNYASAGGSGGGLIAIYSAAEISVTGDIHCDGNDGETATSGGGEVGGGGAGSGGMMLLVAPNLAISGSVSAQGGSGSPSAWHDPGPYGSAYGGDGGDGRIRLEYNSISGSTLPSAGSTTAYVD